MSRGGEVPKVYSREFPFIEKEIVQNELHGDKLLMNSLTHWLCYFSVSIPSEARYAWQDNLQITFSTSKQVWHSCGRLCSESPFYSAEQSFTNEEAQSCCCWTDQHWTCSLLLAHTSTPRHPEAALGPDISRWRRSTISDEDGQWPCWQQRGKRED